MPRKVEIVPRDTNGRIDWLAYVRTSWPIVFFVGLTFYQLGGRLQTPEEKRSQHNMWDMSWNQKTDQHTKQLDELEKESRNHERTEGHSVLVDRVNRILQRVQALESEVHKDQ